MSKSANRSAKKVTRPPKHRATAPVPPSPLAVAEAAVDHVLRDVNDWHGDFVWAHFIDGGDTEPNPLTSIVEAVKARRQARIAAGKWEDGPGTDDQDDMEAAFALGYALGSRFGGAR